MRQLGARLGIPLAIVLVATVGMLDSPAGARSHHHRHHHHHSSGGGGGRTPTAPAAPNICAATPNPVPLTLDGLADFGVTCAGLGPFEAVTIDSLLIRGNCTTTSFPLSLTADAGGGLTFHGTGTNCLTGSYSVQLVGPFSTTEFPVAFTF